MVLDTVHNIVSYVIRRDDFDGSVTILENGEILSDLVDDLDEWNCLLPMRYVLLDSDDRWALMSAKTNG